MSGQEREALARRYERALRDIYRARAATSSRLREMAAEALKREGKRAPPLPVETERAHISREMIEDQRRRNQRAGSGSGYDG